MTQIITHRGLQPSDPNFPSESTLEAFVQHLERGWALEFDPNFTSDGIVVWHDPTLQRLTNRKSALPLSQLTTQEVLQTPTPRGELCTLDDLLDCIAQFSTQNHALHLKGAFHNPKYIDCLVSVLKNHPQAVSKLATTDTPPALTRILKGEFPELQCSPSVAHPYDIKRYNSAVKNTLITLEVAIENKDLYDRVWLDEWDLTSHNGKTKKLYTEENFEKLRAAGLKINVVTPELHRTSPHLLGGESHPDAMSLERLFVRVREILELQPDGICTDYPEEVLDLLGKTASIVR